MKYKIHKRLLLMLPILIIISLFEIVNIKAYYKDQIQIGGILIQESKKSFKIKTKELEQLDEEGKSLVRKEYLIETLICIFIITFIILVYLNR